MTANSGSEPQTYATATYGAAGQLLTLAYGGTTETRTYNSLMQLTGQSVPGYLNMTYNFSATQNNGRITSSVDGVTGENTAYAYDALNRLTGASNSLWSEQYTYDGFCNLLYDQNNHRSGQSYDANGNTSSANNNSIGFTVENKMNSQTSQWYPYGETLFAYDPNGKRVMKETNPDPYNYEGENSPSWEFYFYAIDGKRLVTMDCSNPNGNPLPSCWVVGQNIYFKKKMLVSNGVNVVTDRLGTVRANTQGESFAYFPYGEERTSTVDGRDKFATYFRDGVGQDYADQRYYNAGMGRFWTADPTSGQAVVPASLNRYAYVQGDPINLNDPGGLDPNCGPNMVWDGEGCTNGAGSPLPDASVPSSVDITAVVSSQGQQINTGSDFGTWSSDLIQEYYFYLAGLDGTAFQAGTIAIPVGGVVCAGSGACKGIIGTIGRNSRSRLARTQPSATRSRCTG